MVIMVASDKEKLAKAMEALKKGKNDVAQILLSQVADSFALQGLHSKAANLYEKVAILGSQLDKTEVALRAIENATLMYVRLSDEGVYKDIVRLNERGSKIAEKAEMYDKAADGYFRALDFAAAEQERDRLTCKAADALENLADIFEERNEFEEAVNTLKKVGRLYYSAGDRELGLRIHERAIRVAIRWADQAKDSKNYLAAGNALAEAAQIIQNQGDNVEAARLMMEAGEYYEKGELHEKAGNIYDAAQEAYDFERLTSATKQAMAQAAEAYMKMEGKPQVLAPLLVKAGDMFSELGRVMKAKWAYKRASELFAELAKKAAEEGDIDSEKTNLRYRAMGLRKWGREREADEIYTEVAQYYLNQGKREEERGNVERQALSLEEASKVLYEYGDEEKAQKSLKQATKIYRNLAQTATDSEEPEDASKFFGRAAECAGRLGEKERKKEFHILASKRAEDAARYFADVGLKELSTIWKRTAAEEALKTHNPDMVDRAIDLLKESAKGFQETGELKEAFEDLYTMFLTVYIHKPEERSNLDAIVEQMNEIAIDERDLYYSSMVNVIRAVNKSDKIGALLAFQEQEDELIGKRESLRSLIEAVEPPEETDEDAPKDSTHWLYK